MLLDIIDDAQYLTETHYKIIEDVVLLTAKKLGLHDKTEVDISIVDNETIHDLNKTYRNIDRPTDVLSFAMTEVTSEFDVDFEEIAYFEEGDAASVETTVEENAYLPEHLGDIIISYPKCVEQASEYGHSFERELAFLVVHGFLHLNGYDHQTEEESKEMFGLQEEVLNTYGLTR